MARERLREDCGGLGNGQPPIITYFGTTNKTDKISHFTQKFMFPIHFIEMLTMMSVDDEHHSSENQTSQVIELVTEKEDN